MAQTASELGLTGRKAEVWDRLNQSMKPREIAEDLGVTPNSVYQQITRLREDGFLDDQPARRARTGGGTATATRPTRAQPITADLPVQQSIEQFIKTMNARLATIEGEESHHHAALEQLAAEREEIAAVVKRLRGDS